MNSPKNIEIAEFDYPLPDERIAKFPLEHRDQSKLLHYHNGTLEATTFRHLPELLKADTLLVFNNTKVIHARLFFQKSTGSVIEVFCMEPFQMPIAQAFEQREHCTWICFIGNNKKWKEGSLQRTVDIEGSSVTLTVERREAVGNAWVVDFQWTGGVSLASLFETAGVIPIPPYLHREAEQSDNERYQTVYAELQGSVAAPTAGLHFTPEVFAQLQSKGIHTDFITLHVGAGTFKPVNTPTIGEHEMHIEKIEIGRHNIECILNHIGHPIIPVGTTSVRTIESVYWFGVKLAIEPHLDAMHVLQWDPYELSERALPADEAYRNVVQWMDRNGIERLYGDTQLMIAPGYTYRVISGLVTNFHQPKSTLLLLVSALVGDVWKECYRYALDHEFRFLSYGDSCFFEV